MKFLCDREAAIAVKAFAGFRPALAALAAFALGVGGLLGSSVAQTNQNQTEAHVGFQSQSQPAPLDLVSPALAAASMPRAQDFTTMWWVNGPPDYLRKVDPPSEPVLCLQSGTLGLMMDTRSLRFLHGGRFGSPFPGMPPLDHARRAIAKLPEIPLSLTVRHQGRRFRCVGRGADPKDPFFFPVRFVESGRFLQRIVIDGLELIDDEGQRLETAASLELALWPDRLTLCFLVERSGSVREGELAIASGSRQVSGRLETAGFVTLDLFTPPRKAASVQPGKGAESTWDERLGAWSVRLPDLPWRNAKQTSYPEEELDRLDRWAFSLRNDSELETVTPIVFSPVSFPAITGMTALLCEPDGTPTGIPMQLSKNWHANPAKGELRYQGPWVHACAFVRMPPRSERRLVLTFAYARWGGLPAASHAQLCLIGWGHNQFWDQAAIGSFGESICYEPGRVQRRCFIDDIRPFMTLMGPEAKPYGWAGNGGGGDFLMWMDEAGKYRGFRSTRTDYRAQGPCLATTEYTEETQDGEVAARMEVSIARSDDYLRAFHRVRYDVRKPLRWQRLAFYQLGADFYNETPSRKVAVGDATGLREEWQPVLARDVVDRRPLPLTGSQPWVSVHGLERAVLQPGLAAASRGLVVRSWNAVLGGKRNPIPHVSTFATEWGEKNFKTVVELVPPPDLAMLKPGDFVEADLELVMFPAHADDYYGPNQAFRRALEADPDSWRLVAREAAGNSLEVNVRRGKVQQRFPLKIAAGSGQRAEVVVKGGFGYTPVTFTGLKSHRGFALLMDGRTVDQSVHGNDFWQTDYDSASRTWSLTWNVLLEGRSHSLKLIHHE